MSPYLFSYCLPLLSKSRRGLTISFNNVANQVANTWPKSIRRRMPGHDTRPLVVWMVQTAGTPAPYSAVAPAAHYPLLQPPGALHQARHHQFTRPAVTTSPAVHHRHMVRRACCTMHRHPLHSVVHRGVSCLPGRHCCYLNVRHCPPHGRQNG